MLCTQALSSPTRKNIEEALRGGVEANELTSVLPAHLQPPEPRYCLLCPVRSILYMSQSALCAPCKPQAYMQITVQVSDLACSEASSVPVHLSLTISGVCTSLQLLTLTQSLAELCVCGF